MTYSDSLGLWTSLGVISATIDRWQKFYRQATWERDTFRVTFQGNLNTVESFVLVRQVFPEDLVTPSIRYYPKSEPQILHLPIPADLSQNNIGVRSIEVKQAERYRKWMGWKEYPPIPIKIEELSGY